MNISAEDVVNKLNDLVEADPTAMQELINSRVQCNDELADHPTCQVTQDQEVGFLGVINSLFPVDCKGRGAVVAVMDDDGLLDAFILGSEVWA